MPMPIDEYCHLEEPCCPYCGSKDIVGGSVQIDKATAWQPITCSACGKNGTTSIHLPLMSRLGNKEINSNAKERNEGNSNHTGCH